MATREEIINGLEFTVAQAKRTTALWPESEWNEKRPVGWTPKEIYAHLAAVAGIVPQLSAGLQGAPEATDIAGGMDINAMNDQAVKAMEGMSHNQVFEAFEKNYAALIDFIKAAPDEQLQAKRSFLSDPIPVSDIIASTVMLHGIHHVYEANSRFPG
jgi:hypothetical protein